MEVIIILINTFLSQIYYCHVTMNFFKVRILVLSILYNCTEYLLKSYIKTYSLRKLKESRSKIH